MGDTRRLLVLLFAALRLENAQQACQDVHAFIALAQEHAWMDNGSLYGRRKTRSLRLSVLD